MKSHPFARLGFYCSGERNWVPVLVMLSWEMGSWQFKWICFIHIWVATSHRSCAWVKWWRHRWHLFFQSTQLLSYKRKAYLFPLSPQLNFSPWHGITSSQNYGTVGKSTQTQVKINAFFFFLIFIIKLTHLSNLTGNKKQLQDIANVLSVENRVKANEVTSTTAEQQHCPDELFPQIYTLTNIYIYS